MVRKSHNAVLAVCLLFLSSLFLSSRSWSDTLKFKNGSTLIGTYAGGSDREVAFRVGSTVQHYDIADVASLTFDSNGKVSSSDSQALPSKTTESPASEQSRPVYRSFSNNPTNVTVPVGTRLVVRTIDAVDSNKNQVGDKFQATLEEGIYVNDVLVVPRGANVYGRLEEVKEAGHISGKSELKLALTGMVINGQTVPISTGDYEVSGKSRGTNTAKKVGGGAALGAVIGAIAGGGKGAAIGAGVGAGAGTGVQILTKGDQVHVPSETLLEFTLDQSFTVSR